MLVIHPLNMTHDTSSNRGLRASLDPLGNAGLVFRVFSYTECVLQGTHSVYETEDAFVSSLLESAIVCTYMYNIVQVYCAHVVTTVCNKMIWLIWVTRNLEQYACSGECRIILLQMYIVCSGVCVLCMYVYLYCVNPMACTEDKSYRGISMRQPYIHAYMGMKCIQRTNHMGQDVCTKDHKMHVQSTTLYGDTICIYHDQCMGRWDVPMMIYIQRANLMGTRCMYNSCSIENSTHESIHMHKLPAWRCVCVCVCVRVCLWM